MKKDQRFLNQLEEKLKEIPKKKKDIIIDKYKNLIVEEKNKGRKITDIIKSFGNIDEIVVNETKNIKSNPIKNIINKLDNIKLFEKKNKSNIKKELNKKTKKIEKETKKKVKKESVKLLDKIKSFFNKFKKKKTFKEEVVEEIKEVKEEINETLEEVVEIVPEKRLFESKEKRFRRIIFKILGVLILMILLFILLVVSTLFVASLFAILDGIKFYGITLALFGLILLNMWVLIITNKLVFNKKINGKVFFAFIILIMFVIATGIAMTIDKLADIKTVKDVSDKYTMTRYYESINLPIDTEKKYYVSFNSNYQTKYVIEYDKKLKDKITVEVKYYESYYDFYSKKTSNSMYISLAEDKRDRLSVYIDDLREDKIYDSNELSRYTVTIRMNKKDANRVIIY